MERNVMLQCQVSQTWQAKIEKIAADRNKSSEEIMREAIALYLGETNLNSSDRFMALEKDVSVLKQMLSQLTTTVKLLQQQPLSPNFPHTNPISMMPENAIAQEEEEEDWEDEPDEILYDFLEPS